MSSSLVFLNGLAGVAVLGGGGEQVAQFLGVQRLLRREQNRFQYEFQFHAKMIRFTRRAAASGGRRCGSRRGRRRW